MKLPFWPNPKGYRDIDLGLSRVFSLLERLDNPHLKLPPTIHIAGTNGKGSTLSFLRFIFAESGLSIHSYTSPHLVNFNERILLNGEEIDDQFLNEILLECKNVSEISPEIPVTFFEGITVAAFVAFSRIKADLLLLETGMGGRLDATNVLPEVLCSIITPISLDHQEFLGKTLRKIAREKAGIIKKNSLVIAGKQRAEVAKLLAATAKECESEFKIFASDWKVKKQKNQFLFRGFGREIFLPNPSLIGSHQIENCSVAIAAALSQKKFLIEENQIKSAIKKTFWPARLQKIISGKFFDFLPKNYELFLDGSHNIQCARTILSFLKLQKKTKIFVIFSMLKDKDCEGFLRVIFRKIDHLIAVEIPGEIKSRKLDEISKIAESLRINSGFAKNISDALKQILSLNKSEEKALILVCGSLYLAGNFLEENQGDFKS